jgi:hypothetical protein
VFDFKMRDKFTGTRLATYIRDTLSSDAIGVNESQPGPTNGIRAALSPSDAEPLPGLPTLYYYTM